MKSSCYFFCWVQRAASAFKNRAKICSSKPKLLTAEEMQNAEKFYCLSVQRTCFAEEIRELEKGRPVSMSSSIYKLTPELDEDGILRLGG